MNALLQTISDNASEDLKRLIEEGAEDILKAIHKTEEEAKANDAKPKFSLGFKITVDFDAAAYACDLSWSLKQTLGTTHRIKDPNQPPLPIDEDRKSFDTTKLTIRTGDREVETTVGGLKKVASKLSKK